MLRRAVLPVLVLSLLTLASAVAAQSVRWEPYRNINFNFAAELPLGPFVVDSETADGLTLIESAGRGQIDIYGAHNTARLPLPAFERTVAGAERIREVTYRRRGNSWLVLSGYYRREGDDAADLIFYAKFMFSPDGEKLSAFEASYPRSDKARYDPLIERLEDSLTSPR